MLRKFRVRVDGKDYMVDVEEITAGNAPAEVPLPVQKAAVSQSAPAPVAAPKPQPKKEVPAEPKAAPAAPVVGGRTVIAPMSGTILDVFVSQGAQVSNGQKVLVLEAMKMENAILSEYDGKVVEIKVNKGDSVEAGDTLLVIG